MRRVAVIGGGMTLFRRRLLETGKELSYLATKMAMEDAEIEKKDIARRFGVTHRQIYRILAKMRKE